MFKKLIIKAWNMIRKSHPVFKILGGLIAAVASSIAIFTFISSYIPPHMLMAKLQDNAPWCETDSVNKSFWMIPESVKSSTSLQCSNIYGLEIVPSSSASLAEFDLDQINGQPYSQTALDVKITLTFGNTSDSNTMAGLVVQTPQQGTGGYGLAISNTGYWELVNNNKKREASGNITTPQTVYHLELKVDGGKIYGWINGEQVLAYNDISDTPNTSKSAIGLIIFNRFQYPDGSNPPLNSVYFSNFVLLFLV